MINTARVIAAAAGVLVVLAVGGAPATADPPPGDPLVGVGSEYTLPAMLALGTVEPVTCNGMTAPRPTGSAQGRQALRASQGEDLGSGPGIFNGVNVFGCFDFARSTTYGGVTPQTVGNYTYVPLGVDAVTLAIHKDGDLPFNWSFAQIQRVYRCLSTSLTVTPRLGLASGGTWEFWRARMQITEAEIFAGDYPCLAFDHDSNVGTEALPVWPRVPDNDGTALAGNLTHVMPFAIPAYLAQANSADIATHTGQVVTDRRGPTHLVGVSTPGQPIVQPVVGGVLNINFPAQLRRDVYNVVPTADLTEPRIAPMFVGAASTVCAAAVGTVPARRVTELFGFGYRTTSAGPLEASCGSTDLRFNS